MNIGIFGGAEESSPEVHKKAYEIGKTLAKKGHTIITGACPGIPYEATKGAFKEGGYTIGFSPAKNKSEHIEKFQSPYKEYSKLIYVPKNYIYLKNKNACYKYRNISSVINSDKIIIIGGRYGTLNEFTLAYEFGKEIGILTNTGGAAEIIEEIIQKNSSKIKKETGAKIFFSQDINKLLEKLNIK